MTKVKIQSTLQNKEEQKKAVHNNSSTVFLAVCSVDGLIDTEISLLNHFILKRGISDVEATIEIRELNGIIIKTLKLRMNEERVYSLRLSEEVEASFVGSIYVYFQSNQNLAVPFCAVMCSIKSKNSVCGVHTYGRRLEEKELGSSLDLTNTIETGWTARDSLQTKSFAVLHGGFFDLDLNVNLEISNSTNIKLLLKEKFKLKAFGTLIITPQDLTPDVIAHLGGKKGHIKVYINGLSGIFPRMLCGNYNASSNSDNELINADEIQFTHTNFDFSTIEQPEASGAYGYYNQPNLPNGYGIIYPVSTSKPIFIGNNKYISDSMPNLKVDSMSQIEIKADGENLPSRFVAAAIGTWPGAELESECSTGTFVEDYLRVSCHWHWGLLKPGFENGNSIISIILNRFNRSEDLSRTLKLRLFDEAMLLVEEDITINGHKEINTSDFLPKKLPEGTIWYVLNGDSLEDLNIFSTFYPEKKSGFVEHAF